MESADQKHQGTCQDTERSPNLTSSRLPDEVLLEIFDSYRQSCWQSIDQYDYEWRKKYGWFNLAHVCGRWRAVMFASSFRLDLNIIVGPRKPGHIKTILSGHLPILIDYSYRYRPRDIITGSAIWRMHAALGHRDRVREITFEGFDLIFGNFIKATSYHFPALESLHLWFPRGHEPEIPATFLRGPDQSDLRLRRLTLHDGSLASVSGLLLSATALTVLTLSLTPTNAAVFDPSQGSFLLACLRGMQCLRSLDLSTELDPRDLPSQDSTPKDIVPLLKLTRFHYYGPTTFLNSFMSGLSAPSLQDARLVLDSKSPLFYLSRVIDDVREEFRTPSTKLAMAEELTLNHFPSSNITNWDDLFSFPEFLRQFRSVRVLRLNPFMREVGLCLQQDDGEAILPVLEEIELSILRLTNYSDEEYQRRVAEALAAFEPCERAGRLVKVYHCEQTQMRYRNARGGQWIYEL
ncbi:hypothetical protein V8E52_000775 [Russula decolorans]